MASPSCPRLVAACSTRPSASASSSLRSLLALTGSVLCLISDSSLPFSRLHFWMLLPQSVSIHFDHPHLPTSTLSCLWSRPTPAPSANPQAPGSAMFCPPTHPVAQLPSCVCPRPQRGGGGRSRSAGGRGRDSYSLGTVPGPRPHLALPPAGPQPVQPLSLPGPPTPCNDL